MIALLNNSHLKDVRTLQFYLDSCYVFSSLIRVGHFGLFSSLVLSFALFILSEGAEHTHTYT